MPAGSARAETYNPALDKLEILNAELKKVADKYGVGPAQIPVAWAIAKGTLPKGQMQEEIERGRPEDQMIRRNTIMRKKNRILSVITAVLLAASLAACGNTVHAEEETADPAEHADILVAYFSATGTTKGVAEKIAAVTGGDLYEILAAEPYSDEDLNYNDSSSRTTLEQNDKNVRPEIGSEELSLEGYTTMYLGFPIWWGEEPRILDTFVEKYSFEGVTVIPFCTSASSGIGRSGPNMEALAGSGTWLEGERFSGSVSEEELQAWIDSLQ